MIIELNTRPEQTRACYPDAAGSLERSGVRIYYEAYGTGEQTALLFPTWEIVHSRAWKCQIPYLARHGRVVTFDRRGNGRSDRPGQVRAYDRRETTVIQGGLTTAMELTASRRPFLCFRLRHHFEQTLHVRHRLERYRAGQHMDYDSAGPAEISGAIASHIGRDVNYRPVATDGAARAASMLAALL